MRIIIGVALAASITACGPLARKEKTTVEAPDLSDQLSIGCYTVDLFDPYKIKHPKNGVPAEHARFLGVWQDGAWDQEEWCHDLYVTEVLADGSVKLLEAYGPSKKRSTAGVVFNRTGKIEDNVLTFIGAGNARLKYKLVGNYLVGERTDLFSQMSATLRRTDGIALVPLPPRNPRRT